MHPQTTFELRLSPQGASPEEISHTKSVLVQWLLDQGCTAFVEGALDCDVDHDYENEHRDFYSELDGNQAPLSLYRYNREELDDLASKVAMAFGDSIKATMHSHSTQEWMEGWKESFLPFTTKRFYVRPPWCDRGKSDAPMDLVIEPGMAFGTGQHATTQLCLQEIELLAEGAGELEKKSVLDVGTGTGILAIAAHKLGYDSIAATDIEADAVAATLENAKMNEVQIAVALGSVSAGTYDLVVANILAVVLKKIMGDLARAVKPGGTLLLSGILVEEEGELVDLVKQHGLVIKHTAQLSGWTAIVGQRP